MRAAEPSSCPIILERPKSSSLAKGKYPSGEGLSRRMTFSGLTSLVFGGVVWWWCGGGGQRGGDSPTSHHITYPRNGALQS